MTVKYKNQVYNTRVYAFSPNNIFEKVSSNFKRRRYFPKNSYVRQTLLYTYTFQK